MHTPENITALEPNQIFVFGSNKVGRHGAGAALLARNKFGAVYGVGEGPTGRCYAIPTKDEHLRTLPLSEISQSVDRFLVYARANPSLQFLVTKIGAGLAGYSCEEVRDNCFKNKDIPSNVILPIEFSYARVD